MSDSNKRLLNFHDDLVKDRRPWDALYQEVADYMLPRRAAFTSDISPGENRYDYIFDDTGPWALEQFANGLHSMLTSSLTRWFGLTLRSDDPEAAGDLTENRDLMAWKDRAQQTLYDQFNNPTSSFHPMVQEVYTDVGAFGYGTGYSEWSDRDGAVQFQARFPGEIYLVEDNYGRVRGVTRCYKLKAHQFAEEFGADKMPARDKEQWEQGKLFKEYDIIHAVLPREWPQMEPFGVAERYTYGSVRICRQVDEPLAVAGFRSFPFHSARWNKRTGQVYSTSPAITALPSVRRVNAAQLDMTKIVNRWADPPVQGPDQEHLAPYDLSPGAQNYYRPGSGDRVEAINGVLGEISPAFQWIDATQQSIIRTFYVEAFLTTADSNGQNVKATFVNQRRDERFRQLAAMLSRIEREFLSSVIQRTFDLCEDNGLIDTPPIDGFALEIDYLSPITRAQRSEVLDGLYQSVELSAMAAQYDPSVMEGYNWAQIQRDSGIDIFGLPERWFKGDEEVQAARRQQNESQQLLTESETAANYGKGIRDVAQADISQAAE